MKNSLDFAEIPMRAIGPMKITGDVVTGEVRVPLATFEIPLWPSVNRGAKLSRACEGIHVTIIQENMARSILLEAQDARHAKSIIEDLEKKRADLEQVVSSTSQYAQLKEWHSQIVGKLIFLRFSMNTGDAAGHNMTTKACDALINWILSEYPHLQYVSISGNFCMDKKASAVNGILGRGRYAIAEITVPKALCDSYLRATVQKIVSLNIKKNLIGSIIAGGIRSANAHFANMLLAFYLATGQDAANIVEGSQGIVHAEETQSGDLYFSVTLPNIIVGTVGNGKQHEFVRHNLSMLGCLANDHQTGDAARRLAAIAAATVLCGELSLLAAQTNRGELTDSHLRLERVARMKNQESISC